MYRFVNKQSFMSKNACFMSRQVVTRTPTQLCSFCNFYHPKLIRTGSNFQIHKRTIINATHGHLSLMKKNMKQGLKKYTELLEVTDKTIISKEIAVRRLKSNHFSTLVNQPNCGFNQLHEPHYHAMNNETRKFRTYTHSNSGVRNYDLHNKNSINILPNPKLLKESEEYFSDKSAFFEDLKHSGICDSTALIKSSSLLDGLNVQQADEKYFATRQNLKPHTESVHEKSLDIIYFERKVKTIDQYINALAAYIEVYVHSGMLDHAYKILSHANIKYRKFDENGVKFVDLYNMLLEACTMKECTERALEIYKDMMKSSMPLNTQTYNYVFYSIGKMRSIDNTDKLDILRSVKSQMEENGISFNDLFNRGKFKVDQRETILKMIQILEPQFEAVFIPIDMEYHCSLLKKIPKNTKQPDLTDVLSVTALRNGFSEQFKVEKKSQITVKSIEKRVDTEYIEECRQQIAQYEKQWEEAATHVFERNLYYLTKREKESATPDAILLHPFLQLLDQQEYINILIQEMRQSFKNSELFSSPLPILQQQLGLQIYRKYEVKTKSENGILDKTVQIYQDYLEWYLNRAAVHGRYCENSRIAWQTLEYKNQDKGASLDRKNAPWSSNLCRQVGRFLYVIILHDIKFKIGEIGESLPTFYTIFRPKGKGMTEEIRPHPYLAKLYRNAGCETLTFDATLVPSLCPVRPWTSVHAGGYIFTETHFIRAPITACHLWERLEETPNENLYPSFDSLNQLGLVPWSINTTVLDLIIKVFQSGGSEKLNVPRPPSVLSPMPAITKNVTGLEKYKLVIARSRIKRRAAELYSLWCDGLYRLSLANHYRDKIFWLPHNMDFRGRVYPLPPHLSHLGSDIARAILLFAQAKPLGPNGLDWLKIHVVNLTGLKKKESMEDRLKYANEILDKIIDSAENPMAGENWWMTSEEPWQTLAACMEIAAAIKSGDPENYKCRYPVHQDGSCNGLQHYAALGRDEYGAESVNLRPRSKPHDVYSEVVSMVDEKRQFDADNGVPIAKVLEGFISRKVIKQTVMTTVYGVTKFGAKLQITRQLKDIENFPQEHLWTGSIYLTDKTFESLRKMFESAKQIQDWFTECAQAISATCGETVEWITPLGLPVVQPYLKERKPKEGQCEQIWKPDVIKQKNAFAPNFIHSLDSTHMMLTSMFSEQAGITFMSVHDCYWTHPSTVEIMNKICREQFVALHSEPILENLSDVFIKIYTEKLPRTANLNKQKQEDLQKRITQIPSKGQFDLKEVLSSTYFFS